MQLIAHRHPSLPKLAWVAEVDRGHSLVTLDHGPLVEVRPTFWIEGVWNGSFQRGDFGTTECVFGTGGIVAEDSVRFVTSAATVDYLFYAETGDHVTVSNSLPLLLASIGDTLNPHCREYPRICNSILRGIEDYERTIPTQRGHVKRVMYWNLDVSNKAIAESDKREPPHFPSFKAYRDYLRDNYALIAANARDAARTTPLEIWSTQSKGYDSTAVNALCSPSGIDQVVTISQAKAPTHLAHQDAGVQHEDDDGGEICDSLGLPCIRLDRRSFVREYDDEALYYCVLHECQDTNLEDLKKHLRTVTLLLTGTHGDIVWPDAAGAKKIGIDSVIRRGDPGGHGMGELRLNRGFIQLPFPFMGARRKAEIIAITESEEMRPWRINTGYDRPIPRRIAEEAGIPRHIFGQSKQASVVIFPQPSIPYGKALREEFFTYLAAQGLLSPSRTWLWPVVRWFNSILKLRKERSFHVVYVIEDLLAKLRGQLRGRPTFEFARLWSHLNGSLLCFCVNRQARQYAQIMEKRHLTMLTKD
jgi:hypothetical protein